MKNKIYIILIIGGIIIFLLINNKISEARIKNVVNDYSYNTSEYLNKIILENENINYNIIDNLKDINRLKENINNEIEKYNLDNIDLSFELLDIKFVEAIKIRYDYIKYLNNILEDIKYLENNYKNYYFRDNTYICKDSVMLEYLKNLKEKYNLEINIKLGNNENKDIPILLYHGILDDTWGAATLFVKPSEFDTQIKYLKDNNYTPLFISELDYIYAFDKPVIITFDDAYVDVYTNALPILKKYDFKANVYVITGSIGADLYMNESMIKEANNSGLIEIGSHTISHYKLGEIDLATAEIEIKESKEVLENLLNEEIKSIAYPSGSFNQNIIDIVKNYYDYGLSTIYGKEKSNKLNTYSLKRYYVYREYSLEDFKKLL